MQKFFVTGISYKKSDLDHRSRFAFNHDDCVNTYNSSGGNFFILSTCNRTEIYGFEDDHKGILLSRSGDVTPEVYAKQDDEAITHFFRVAAGLDSQIPGDYEIIAQIKSSFLLAKTQGHVNGFMEKMFNYALQASKEVKNTTSFSDGTISVAWSVASQIAKSDSEKISVLGAGETGELVIRYLRKLCPGIRINLVNRDVSKLYLVANKYDVLPFPLTGLHEALIDSRALVVTTNSSQPLVHAEHVAGSALKTIYDLSVPRNVAGRVYQIINVRDVDDISARINETIENRLREIPRVEQIIAHHIEEFKNWSYRRQLYSINQ